MYLLTVGAADHSLPPFVQSTPRLFTRQRVRRCEMIAPKPPLNHPKVGTRLRMASRMTICAGMLCTDGIILCADAMEAVGGVHRSVEKLVELAVVSDDLHAVAVSATDDVVFSDALLEKISESL